MSKEGTLWTVIINVENNLLIDAYDQQEPVCRGGPDTCGGCRDCIISQCDGSGPWIIRRNVEYSEMISIGKTGYQS